MTLARNHLVGAAALCTALLGSLMINPAPSATAETVAPNLKVLTYNVKSHDTYPTRPWSARRAKTIAVVEGQAPDIFGLQEATKSGTTVDPILNFRNQLPQYDSFPDPKNVAPNPAGAPVNPGLTRPIFWSKARFTPLTAGYASIGNQSNPCASGANRMVWVELQDNQAPAGSNKYFVVNVHMQNGEDCSAFRAAAVSDIHAQIAAHRSSDSAIIAMGDFNTDRPACGDGESTIPNMLATQATYNLTIVNDDCNRKTFDAKWNHSLADDNVVYDYIFYSTSKFDVGAWGVDNQQTYNPGDGAGMISPSDHYAVVTRLVRK
jgi:endonuclease/exonuclease/phosphatase family metal-dependent hydrolase